MICSSLCRVPFIAVLLSWVWENSHSTWSTFRGLGQPRSSLSPAEPPLSFLAEFRSIPRCVFWNSNTTDSAAVCRLVRKPVAASPLRANAPALDFGHTIAIALWGHAVNVCPAH